MLFNKIEAERIGLEIGQGYWSVNNMFFFNKSECLRLASKMGLTYKSVRYHYLESAYMSLDWTKEPHGDLDFWYAERARQLRDKYDYLILSFSGGADSTNILNTFVNNKIHLDEVVCCYPSDIISKLYDSFDANDKSPDNIMFEYKMAAEPRLMELAKTNPEIKITIIDYTKYSLSLILTGKMDKVFPGGISSAPIHVGHYMIGEKLRSLSEKVKACAISGLDKPRLMYNPITNKFASYFHDLTNGFGNYSEASFDGFRPDFQHFYYTSDMPQLMQKQCFVIKREILNQLKIDYSIIKNLIITNVGDFLILDMHTDYIKNILYKHWKVNPAWQADKDTHRLFYQSQSIWFHDEKFTTKRERDYYAGQVDDLITGINDSFIHYYNGKIGKFKDMTSSLIQF